MRNIKFYAVFLFLVISISGILLLANDSFARNVDKSKNDFSLVAKAKKSERKAAQKPAQKKKTQKNKSQKPAQKTNIDMGTGSLPDSLPQGFPASLPEGFPQAGSNDFMQQMMQQMMGQGGAGGAASGAGGATFDVTKEPLPKIAVANFIDLDWQVQRISKFRGGYGHDYSFGTGETCRSMKHYFWAKGGDPGQPHNPKWMTIALYAPADGVIERVQISNNQDGPEAQFSVLVDTNKAFRFGFHHVKLEPGLTNGSQVKAGQKLGTIGNEQNHGEIAVEIMITKGRSLVSFFEVASDEVLKAYAARGLTDIKNVIHTKEARDAKPLTCDKKTVDGRFVGGSYDGMTDSAGMPNWLELN